MTDTGAREPQRAVFDKHLIASCIKRTVAGRSQRLEAKAIRWLAAENERLAALAAGVSVPPDKEKSLGSALHKDRGDARAIPGGPWKCEGCGWTNPGYAYVRECDGCGEPKSTALLSRSGALAELEASEARARAARFPNPSAGVGEARPEPRCHRCGGKLPLEGEDYDVRVTDYCCAKCAVEVVAGEARPAEPPTDPARDIAAEYAAYPEDYQVSAPAEEQPDARERYERARRIALPTGDPSELDALFAELGGLLDNERLYTAEHRGYAQVVGEENKLLREQLDAANRETGEYRRMWEETLTKLDAALGYLAEFNPDAAREIERLRRFLTRIASPDEIAGGGETERMIGPAAREMRARMAMAQRGLNGDEYP